MGDSDDEYDRKRRDKFRGERGDAGYRGTERIVRPRDDWTERDTWTRPRPRDYRTGGVRDRGYSPSLDPVPKRMRHDYYSDSYYNHYPSYHQSSHRETTTTQVEGQQPPMMSFKAFLATQDDNISDSEAIEKYNDYKLEFQRQQLNEFFVAHKDDEWFRLKYHPEDSVKRKEEQMAALKKRLSVFMELLETGKLNVSVDCSKTDELLKLLDSVVIKLEGGTEEDLSLLDQEYTEIEEKTKEQIKESIVTPLSTLITSITTTTTTTTTTAIATTATATATTTITTTTTTTLTPTTTTSILTIATSSASSSLSSTSSLSLSLSVSSLSSSPSKFSITSTSGISSITTTTPTTTMIPSTDIKNEENDEIEEHEVNDKSLTIPLKNEDDEKEEKQNGEKSADISAEDGEIDNDLLISKSDEQLIKIHKQEEEEEEEEEEEKDNKADISLEIDQENKMEIDGQVDNISIKRKRSYSGSSSSSSSEGGGVDSSSTTSDEKEEINENNDKILENKNNIINDNKIERIDEKIEKPRALHKTTSIFLRNLAPTITKQEVEAICARYEGFLRVALADPQPERRWIRRGWVTFKRDANIKEICWNLNNIRLRDCELGSIVNRDLSRRIRPVNGITAHKHIVRSDIRISAKVILNLDNKSGLWQDEENCKKDKPQQTFGLISNNPVLHNITDYLIEEASAEEEELLGLEPTSDTQDSTTIVERDENLIAVLDRIILYLRIVHSVDYYNHCEYPNEDEMPNRCGILHARGPPPTTKTDMTNFIGNAVESKMTAFLPEKPRDENKNETKLINLSLKDVDTEIDKFVQANTRELAKDKWLCPLSGKKFKGPDFVRKHIFNKHAEKIEEVKKEVEFFNNYLRDQKRPMLAETPPTKREETTNFAHTSYGTSNFGNYSRMPPYYNQGYSQRSRGYLPRSRGGPDFRPIIHYRDLDAPREPEEFI